MFANCVLCLLFLYKLVFLNKPLHKFKLIRTVCLQSPDTLFIPYNIVKPSVVYKNKINLSLKIIKPNYFSLSRLILTATKLSCRHPNVT